MAETKSASAPRSRSQREEGLEGRRSGSLQRRHSDEGLGFPGLFGTSPFELMRRMTHEMDRAFDRIFEDFGTGRGPWRSPFAVSEGVSTWSPRIEAFQKDDQLVVRAELPGLKKDDVEVNVTEDAITIQGQRQEEHERKEEGFYHSERSYGSFFRTIPLPEGVITDSAKASFRDGVLEIRLQAPPNEVSRGRRIEIGDSLEGEKK
jgi:HSP20 family protein